MEKKFVIQSNSISEESELEFWMVQSTVIAKEWFYELRLLKNDSVNIDNWKLILCNLVTN